MGFWKTIMELLFEDRFEDEDDDFEKAVKQGKINPKDYKYNYRPPKVLETIEGSYEGWEAELLPEAKLVTILGKRRIGKTALCLNFAENITAKKDISIQTIGMSDTLLPPFITDIDNINEVSNNSVFAVGEGAIEGNARASSSKANVNLAKLLPIISHKNVWVLWCSQSSFKTDRNTIFEADTLILMKPSLLQIKGERKVVKDLYTEYLPVLKKWEKKIGSAKGLAIMYSDKFIGIIRGQLPSFWNEGISKSYAEKEVMN